MAGGSLPVSTVKNGSFQCPLPVGDTVKGPESIPGHGVFRPGSCPAHSPSLKPTGFIHISGENINLV